MSSPQGNWNNPYLKSPYTKPVYPSMDGDFIPIRISSPKDYGNKHDMRNNYSWNDGGGGGAGSSGRGRRSWHNNNYNRQQNHGFKQQWHYNKNRRSGDYHNHGNVKKHNYSGSSNYSINYDDINEYMHPSMLEDPWEKLVKQNEFQKKGATEMEQQQQQGDCVDRKDLIKSDLSMEDDQGGTTKNSIN